MHVAIETHVHLQHGECKDNWFTKLYIIYWGQMINVVVAKCECPLSWNKDGTGFPPQGLSERHEEYGSDWPGQSTECSKERSITSELSLQRLKALANYFSVINKWSGMILAVISGCVAKPQLSSPVGTWLRCKVP